MTKDQRPITLTKDERPKTKDESRSVEPTTPRATDNLRSSFVLRPSSTGGYAAKYRVMCRSWHPGAVFVCLFSLQWVEECRRWQQQQQRFNAPVKQQVPRTSRGNCVAPYGGSRSANV